MKTYEFDIKGSVEPVHVVVTHDDDGEFVSVDMGGYDPEYDIAFAAMGGDTSDAAILYGVLTAADIPNIVFKTTMRRDIVTGIKRTGLSLVGRIIVALTLDQAERARVVSQQTRFEGQGAYFIPPMDKIEFVRVLLDSIADQDLLAEIIQEGDKIDSETALKAYRKLDERHREQVAERLPLFRFSLYDLKSLALESSDRARLLFVSRIVQHPHGFQLSGAGHLDAVRVSIDIAESIKDDFMRTSALVSILLYIGTGIKPRQGERIGRILLATDPKVLGGFKKPILEHNKVFTDAQYGRFLALFVWRKKTPE